MTWESRSLFIKRPRLQISGAVGWTSTFAVLLLALQAGGEPVRMALRFERIAIADGEFWRLLTGHVVHLGWTHLALNLAGLALCAAMSPFLFRPRLVWMTALLAINISMLMLVFSPQVSDYVGFSGVLYGLFVCGLWPQRRDPAMAAALLLVVGWMVWQWLGAPMAAEERLIGGTIVSIAHVHGSWLGLLLAVLLRWLERQLQR